MAATPAPERQADSAADVLAAVQAERAAADRAEVRILEPALDWRSCTSSTRPSSSGSSARSRSAGRARPRGVSTASASSPPPCTSPSTPAVCLIADALELAHRLPRVWARVTAGELPPWRARRISSSTFCLPAEGAEHVDRHVARFAHKVGIAQLDRLVEEALVRFDPAQAEQRRPESAENRQRPHSGRT